MTQTAPIVLPAKRLISLDALRGITIAFMIMVNNNASDHAWWFMKHAEWNGLTPTDLVFPTFLFVAGTSTVFALEARLARGATRAQLAWQTLRRALTLFCFGLIVNNIGGAFNTFPHIDPGGWRIYGVLQRIAICYLLVSLFYLWDRGWQSKAVVAGVALVGYFLLMRWVPVPGAGVPGVDIPFLDKDQNLVAWLDRQIFPSRMLYEGTRDPEGLLSDLPSLATALLGMLAGIWLRTSRSLGTRFKGLAFGALAALFLGAIWSIWFPLNKKLWTSSYVLVAAGISAGLFALLFWAVEVKGWRGRWTWIPLVLGSNSIVAYMVSELLGTVTDLIHLSYNGHRIGPLGWFYINTMAHIPDQGLASFVYSVFYLAICFLPVWWMYNRKIFLKV